MKFDSVKEYQEWLAKQLKEKATPAKPKPKTSLKPKTTTED